MRVLIADDQKSVGTSLAEMVGLCHHQVVEVVATGMEAIQAYDRQRPDVVWMD
jgi:CheY-like chemotaxis protein